MEALFNFITNIGLCILGLLAYALHLARAYLNSSFNIKIFLDSQKHFLIWSFLVQLLYAGLMAAYPVLEKWLSYKLIAILNTMVGFELEIPEELVNTIIYLTLTWQLSRYTNKAVKKSSKQ